MLENARTLTRDLQEMEGEGEEVLPEKEGAMQEVLEDLEPASNATRQGISVESVPILSLRATIEEEEEIVLQEEAMTAIWESEISEKVAKIELAGHLMAPATSATRKVTLPENVQEMMMDLTLATLTSARGETTREVLRGGTILQAEEKMEDPGTVEIVTLVVAQKRASIEKEEGRVPGVTLTIPMRESGEQLSDKRS